MHEFLEARAEMSDDERWFARARRAGNRRLARHWRALAEAGAAVAINYRERADSAKNLADELLKTGVRAITVQADVSQPDAVAKMVDFIKSELGAIDILVNNTGIAITRGIDNLSEPDF